MKIPRKLHEMEPTQRFDTLDDAVVIALRDYQGATEDDLDPVFELVARIEALERLQEFYAN